MLKCIKFVKYIKRVIMKEKFKYHIADIANLIIFYSVFMCFFVALIIGIVNFAKGELALSKLLFRVAFVFLMFVPFAIKKIFKITFSRVASSTFYLYMFFAAFIGNVLEVYATFAPWDMIIHFLMGAVLAVLSIYLLNLTVYKKDRSKHNLAFTLIFMVLFAMAISALWEIWEFCGDLIFGLNSQRFMAANGTALIGQQALLDTMLDLCMDFLGALTGVLFTLLMIQIYPKFLKTFTVTKLRNKEQEVEDIEE